jgi:DNA (cytosine-5)-methyltransferase 1
MNKKFTFIDLFCGIGGFHLALESLGGECVFASDIDDDCKIVYNDNFGITPEGDISTNETKTKIPSHDVLCAGFPCQSFSKAGYRRGFQDTRGTLFNDIVEIIKTHMPKYLMLENVRNLTSHDNGKTWKVISEKLQNLGYIFQDPPTVISPHQLGIPQFRQRVVIIAQRKDLPENENLYIRDKLPVINTSIDDILIENLPTSEKYELNKEEIYIIDIWNKFIRGIKGKKPSFPVWADEFRETYNYEKLPKWKQKYIQKNRDLYLSNKAFIDSWFKEHQNLEELPPSRRKFEWQAGNSKPNLWDLVLQMRPSGLRVKRANYFPALVAMNQTSIIGKYKRKLSPQEAKRLQSFPDTFLFNVDDKIAYKQLGNSVNIDVITFMAARLLNKEYGCVYNNKKIQINKQINLKFR